MTPTQRSSPSRLTARRKYAAILLTFCLFVAMGLGTLELFFRTCVSVTDVSYAFWDPVVGPRTAPNQSGRSVRNPMFDVAYHFNAQGWNHPEDYQPVKPAGARRICVVGDSQVESLQVNPNETFFAIAQREMNRPGRPVQWYAFANSGWGTNVHYEVIRHYVVDYRPDVVVLLFVQNDPFDCSPYIVDMGRFRPIYYLGDQDELVLIPPTSEWQPSWKSRIFFQSAMMRYFVVQRALLDRWKSRGNADRPGVGGLPLMDTASLHASSVVPSIDSMSEPARQEMTWRLIEALLRQCKETCEAKGAVFAVAFRGWMEEIEAPRTGKKLVVPPKAEDPWCLSLSRVSEMGREQVEPIARRLGIPYLDLTHALQSMVRDTGKSHIFEGDHHYNALAHEAVGKAMARWMDEVLSAKPARAPQQANPAH